MLKKKPTLLLILDGWGQGKKDNTNAVYVANTPTLDSLMETYPTSILECCGEAVGLPKGQMGNSEVGHLNIGAGRIVYQDIVRIDKAIENGSFFKNKVIYNLISQVKKTGGKLHLMGLVSDGGVHSHQNHLYALIEFAKREGLDQVVVHAFLDGRDTPPKSGKKYIKMLTEKIKEIGCGVIGTISGRYYSMDRDKRWERTKLAYDAMVLGKGYVAYDAVEAVEEAYKRGESDEFVKPTVLVDKNNKPVALVEDGDGIFFFNFRADRIRQIVRSFWQKDFDFFERVKVPDLSGMATMTEYDKEFDLPIAFPPEKLKNILGEVCSNLGFKQFRIAETEKYAHVTYFFNGGVEEPFKGEDRLLIPSPKDVPTYDLKPEMSVFEVTENLIKKWYEKKYELVVCNFANLDMVGHTGNFQATVKACEAVDRCVKKVVDAVLDLDGRLFVTADHGNADEMIDENGQPHTAHSHNPVAFVWIEKNISKGSAKIRERGILGDIAPTILKLWEIKKPDEMSGESLCI